jgi:N-methylhydantoinase B
VTGGKESNFDPITFGVVTSSLEALADEMAITMVHTAHSTVVSDNMDFSTAICDIHGRVVAQGCGIPIQLAAIPKVMDSIETSFAGRIEPGDVFLVNDPMATGLHLPDLVVVRPVFLQQRLLGYAACVAHHLDIGGRAPGGVAVDSTDVFQEGLQIPLVKLYEAGERNDALVDVLLRNVRVPATVLGDLEAELSACHVGSTGLEGLATRYGPDVVQAYCDRLLDYTEERLRSELRQLPDGRYHFVDFMDDNGIGEGPVRLEVTITIDGDGIQADFTGTDPAVHSAVNATETMAESAIFTALRCIVSDDIPNNAGFYRAIRVTVPGGTVLSSPREAAKGARGVTVFRATDLVFGALAQARPDKVLAAGDGGVNMVAISSTAPDGAPLVMIDFISGGWGARPARDGIDGNSTIAANISNAPVEELELQLPIEVIRYGFETGTGGAGCYRGSLAVVRAYRFLGDKGLLQLRSDRTNHRPYGLSGGHPGGESCTTVTEPDGSLVTLPPMITRNISHGAVVTHRTAGGGGHGDPLARIPESVLSDYLDEKVSVAHAADCYGVVIDPDRAEVDLTATANTRATRATRRDQSKAESDERSA